ncbi:Rv3235 family protein [Yinghuangia sp. ASG 101]|uniref:Rv3235 family protein n=1 Tax=Yinghuangia sp. ASG 101 TaxID=2896848 RepID=UPI001E48B547|nr:Rv3235 family protein [Yinghuangia sp. ASG 101]UGQ09566.1 Rv3235 family protein [Yinghuangia sp. ASG 101]
MVQHHTKPAGQTGAAGTRSRRAAANRALREPAHASAGHRTASGPPRKTTDGTTPAVPVDAPAARPLRPTANRTAAVGFDTGHPEPAPRAVAAPRGTRNPAVGRDGGAARGNPGGAGTDVGAGAIPATVPRLEIVRTPAGIAALTGGIEEIVPGAPLPPLRVLRVPRCEPDDEPEYVPAGAAVIPFPVHPPEPERPFLRLVGAPARATPHEPDPAEARRQVHRFAVALAEVLSGARALRQLSDRVTPEVRERVARLRRDLGARRVAGVSLVASNATAPTDNTAEGFLRLRLTGPDRFQAVAVRLDRRTPRTRPNRPPIWVCTALHHR